MWLFVWRNVLMLALIVVVMATTIAPVPVAADPRPDVIPSGLTLGTGSITIGGTAPLNVTVTNRGRGTAYDVAVTISVAAGGTASRVSQISVGNLRPGASTTVVTTFTAPSQPGTYDVIASATVRRDANQTNNSTAVSL